MKAKSIFVCLLISYSFAATADYESINEKLAYKTPKPPGVICIADQCSHITYSNDGDNLLVAWAILHGKKFFGWRPPCYACYYEEEAIEAAMALKEQVKTQFPDAETGYEFRQFSY